MAIAERTGADLRGDLYPHVLAAAVMAAVRAATGHWIAHRGARSLPDVIRQAVRQVAEPPTGGAPAPTGGTPAPSTNPSTTNPR